MLEALGKVHDVRAFNFTRQYPRLLFPGKTQYVGPDDDATPIESTPVLDTLNPFSWSRTARAIRAWGADLLVMKYWMSWFAPSLGWVARNANCKVIPVLDNVIPHEAHWFDKPLTKWFLAPCNGFVTLSDSVAGDLVALRPDARYITLPHPLYSHFGEKLSRREACARLGLDPDRKTLLFFGLIREYKGLDILLDAFDGLPEGYQLLIAGEPYGSFTPYQERIDALAGKERVKIFCQYIPDSQVKEFFSAADVTVLPYRSATQSGVSGVSYHFEVPMIVTDVGGLKDTIGTPGTGIVAPEPSPGAIRESIFRFFADPSVREGCVQAIRREKERLSWNRFCRDLVAFADQV